jgi:signal recognition particle receptor subunit beta
MEFINLLNSNDLKDACILIFANKKDLPTAKDAGKITEAFDLY